jgi:hypothetical protein
MRILIAALALVPAFAQGGGQDRVEHLARARDAWKQAATGRYELVVAVRCFCFAGQRPERFRVEGGRAFALAALDAENAKFFERYNTVDKLFAVIEYAIRMKAEVVRATYHPALGYPTSASIDYSRKVADDELTFEITELQPIAPGDPDEVTASPAVRSLLGAPPRIFGKSAADVFRRMRREPPRSELTPIAASQNDVPDATLRLDYDGLVVTMHIQTAYPASRLFRVDITDASWLAELGIDLPDSRLAVLDRLGQPHLITPTHLLYQESGIAGGDTLRLTFEGDRLIRAGWAYFID